MKLRTSQGNQESSFSLNPSPLPLPPLASFFGVCVIMDSFASKITCQDAVSMDIPHQLSLETELEFGQATISLEAAFKQIYF